jgi:Cu-processing system permease protein
MLIAIIKVTFLEGLRNKTVYGISLMAGLMMAFSIVLSGMIMRDVGKVATDLALSTAIFSSLLVVLFVGITILAKDLERKTIYLAMSRSVPRSSYMVGRFLGLGLLQLLIITILMIASILTLLLVKQIYSNYFGSVSLITVIIAHLFILIQMLVLTAISMFFSIVASSSFVTFMLTIITWLIGSSTQEVKRMLESVDAVQVSKGTKLIVNAAYYIFPNMSLFDLKSFAAHGLLLNVNHLVFSVVYGVMYTIAVLSLTVLIFKHKELA